MKDKPLFSKKSKTKKRGRSFLLSLATLGALGGGEHYVNDTTQYRHSAVEYVQNRFAQNYLSDKKEAFYSWEVVQNNPDTLKRVLDSIVNTQYDKVNENNLKEFIELRKQLLRNLVTILNSQYNRGSLKYNEMLNKVIPSMVEYLKTEIELLPESITKAEQLQEYKKMLEKR